jgi:hypothetical protein
MIVPLVVFNNGLAIFIPIGVIIVWLEKYGNASQIASLSDNCKILLTTAEIGIMIVST